MSCRVELCINEREGDFDAEERSEPELLARATARLSTPKEAASLRSRFSSRVSKEKSEADFLRAVLATTELKVAIILEVPCGVDAD